VAEKISREGFRRILTEAFFVFSGGVSRTETLTGMKGIKGMRR
jgi:hypothetical protein